MVPSDGNVNVPRDYTPDHIADITSAREGDPYRRWVRAPLVPARRASRLDPVVALRQE